MAGSNVKAQQFSTGACHIFVSQGGAMVESPGQGTIQTALPFGAIPQYFGTAETRPRIDIRPEFTPVYDNDFGGVARDQLYDGFDAIVAADTNYWDEDIFRQMAARTRKVGSEDIRGIDWAGLSVGTLMVAEGMTFELWLQFPYGGTGQKFAKMPAGYHFFAAHLLGPDRIEPGTAPKRIRLLWYCQRIKDTSTGDLKLYDHDMSAVPSLQEPFLGQPSYPPAAPPPEGNPILFELGAPKPKFFE